MNHLFDFSPRRAASGRPWALRLAAGALLAAGTVTLSLAASPLAGALALAALVPTLIYVGAAFAPPAARSHAAVLLLGPVAALAAGDVGLALLWLPVVAIVAAAVEVLSRYTTGLRRQAVTDPLTGLRNRNGFVAASKRAIAECRRRGAPLTVVHIDLDGFKAVNDRRGHLEGDRILQLCAEAWRSAIRPGDVLARLGGDEFALVLPDADRAAAVALLARLRTRSPIEWTYGAAELEPGDGIESCLERADVELYDSKAAARGRRRGPSSGSPPVRRYLVPSETGRRGDLCRTFG